MNPQNRQKIIATALGVVLLIVLVWQLGPVFMAPAPPPAPAAATGAAPTPAAAKAAPAAKAAAVTPTDGLDLDSLYANVQQVNFNYNEERLQAAMRDPMAPLVFNQLEGAAAGEDGESGVPMVGKAEQIFLARQMVISGIIYNESAPYAIVDNEVVMPGYTFPTGIVVESISEDSVILRVDDTPIELKLGEQ